MRRSGGGFGYAPTGVGGAGEADVVCALDQDIADDTGLADDDLPQLGRKAAVDQQFSGAQSGERGLSVGFVHDGIAGQ